MSPELLKFFPRRDQKVSYLKQLLKQTDDPKMVAAIQEMYEKMNSISAQCVEASQ